MRCLLWHQSHIMWLLVTVLDNRDPWGFSAPFPFSHWGALCVCLSPRHRLMHALVFGLQTLQHSVPGSFTWPSLNRVQLGSLCLGGGEQAASQGSIWFEPNCSCGVYGLGACPPGAARHLDSPPPWWRHPEMATHWNLSYAVQLERRFWMRPFPSTTELRQISCDVYD